MDVRMDGQACINYIIISFTFSVDGNKKMSNLITVAIW